MNDNIHYAILWFLVIVYMFSTQLYIRLLRQEHWQERNSLWSEYAVMKVQLAEKDAKINALLMEIQILSGDKHE